VGEVDLEIITILYSLLDRISKGKNLLEDTGVDGTTYLNRCSKEQDGNKSAVVWLK
jgi:hypothetical protein